MKERIILFLLLIFITSLMVGCASSDVSRSAANSINNAYLGVSSNCSQLNMADAYQNSSQTTKGVVIGGVTGGLIGSVTNGIGVLPGTVTGAILGGALGAYIDAHTTLVDRLENRGVKLFVLGDQILFVIPSNRIFNPLTPTIRYGAYSTLDLIAQFIGNYLNMSVKVAAYTNNSGCPQVDYALSQQQADNIVRYLWKRCINTRLIYGVGYGGSHLVSCNTLGWACSDNFRIEITFEKLMGCGCQEFPCFTPCCEPPCRTCCE